MPEYHAVVVSHISVTRTLSAGRSCCASSFITCECPNTFSP
jgi:hypothetical protein